MASICFQGLSPGLAYVAPIGMQNLFVINSAVSKSLGRAMATALVVILWDASLGLACFLGAGALMEALPWLQRAILGVGGALVIYMGVGLMHSETSLGERKEDTRPFWASVGAAFVVTRLIRRLL